MLKQQQNKTYEKEIKPTIFELTQVEPKKKIIKFEKKIDNHKKI